MNFLSLSNQDLHLKTIEAATTEKNTTLVLLEFLQEVDRRRLYAERGYSSLWMYIHRELAYSEAQTSERVGAMRLITKIPEVKKELEENKLSLTTAAKLASFSKKEKLAPEKTIELLNQISNQPKRVVERILFAQQAQPEARPDMIKQSGTELSRISFDVDEEFVIMLTRLKELQSNPTLTLQDLFKKTIREYISKRESKVQTSGIKNQRIASHPAEVKTKSPSRYISSEVKNFVRMRSQDQCEYTFSPPGGKTIAEKIRCESRSQLQFDHRFPYALGGSPEKENIRHLCRTHNEWMSEKYFGKRNQPKINSTD